MLSGVIVLRKEAMPKLTHRYPRPEKSHRTKIGPLHVIVEGAPLLREEKTGLGGEIGLPRGGTGIAETIEIIAISPFLDM